ncbi:MAG: hypothetical protein ACHQM6_07840, partial [Candidatus Kapaibacterium sp.]
MMWNIHRQSLFLAVMIFPLAAFAQHTNHEIGFSFAYAGQAPFVDSGKDQENFLRLPVIWN